MKCSPEAGLSLSGHSILSKDAFLKFYDRVFAQANRFRLSWGASSLSLVNVDDAREENSEAIESDSSFLLKHRLIAGWYMLEVQIKSPVVRAMGHVHLGELHKPDNVKPLAFPLYSGRMCKRLVHLDADGKFQFDLRLSRDRFELEHFRLARLTRKFACSRMLMKLRNLHPRYKPCLAGRHYGGQINFLKGAGPLSLWSDYCDLFEETSEIVSYTDWVREYDTLGELARTAMRRQVDHFFKPDDVLHHTIVIYLLLVILWFMVT